MPVRLVAPARSGWTATSHQRRPLSLLSCQTLSVDQEHPTDPNPICLPARPRRRGGHFLRPTTTTTTQMRPIKSPWRSLGSIFPQLALLAERQHHGCRPVVPAIVHSGCYNPISGDRRGPQSWFRAFPSAWVNERLGKCFPDRVVSLDRGSFRLAEEHSGGFKWIPAGAGGVARGNGTALVVAGPSKKV